MPEVSGARREPARQPKQSVLETHLEERELSGPNRPHFRPHISATPRDETDTEQHDSLKTNDMRNQIDTT